MLLVTDEKINANCVVSCITEIYSWQRCNKLRLYVSPSHSWLDTSHLDTAPSPTTFALLLSWFSILDYNSFSLSDVLLYVLMPSTDLCPVLSI